METLNQLICQQHSSKILDQLMNTILERFQCLSNNHQLTSKLQKLQRMETLLWKRWVSKLFLMKVIWLNPAFLKTSYTTKEKMYATVIIKSTAKTHSTMSHMDNGLVKDHKSNPPSKSIQFQEKHLLPLELKLLHFKQQLVKLSNLQKNLQKLSQELALMSSQLVW